jgi:hypothetical protein
LQPAEGQADCREVRHRGEKIAAEASARQGVISAKQIDRGKSHSAIRGPLHHTTRNTVAPRKAVKHLKEEKRENKRGKKENTKEKRENEREKKENEREEREHERKDREHERKREKRKEKERKGKKKREKERKREKKREKERELFTTKRNMHHTEIKREKRKYCL